jgi:hypothetical protein
VPEPLPRAYAVPGARGAEGLLALNLLRDPAFDPRAQVIVPVREPPSFGPFSRPAQTRIVRDSPHEVSIDADLPGEGYVVLLDAFDPGWTARVDGVRAEVLRANVGFKAVRVPPGSHHVLFSYWPLGLTEGAGIAVLTTLGVALLVLREGRRLRGAATTS